MGINVYGYTDHGLSPRDSCIGEIVNEIGIGVGRVTEEVRFGIF